MCRPEGSAHFQRPLLLLPITFAGWGFRQKIFLSLVYKMYHSVFLYAHAVWCTFFRDLREKLWIFEWISFLFIVLVEMTRCYNYCSLSRTDCHQTKKINKCVSTAMKEMKDLAKIRTIRLWDNSSWNVIAEHVCCQRMLRWQCQVQHKLVQVQISVPDDFTGIRDACPVKNLANSATLRQLKCTYHLACS